MVPSKVLGWRTEDNEQFNTKVDIFLSIAANIGPIMTSSGGVLELVHGKVEVFPVLN
jgi:hypothetical protein